MDIKKYWQTRQIVEICHIEIKKKLHALVQGKPEETTMEKLHEIVTLTDMRDKLEKKAERIKACHEH